MIGGGDNGGGGVVYTITFNAGGGTGAPESAKTGTNGKLASLPTPTRTGYEFDGWFTAATGGEAVTADKVYGSSTTIYAHWTATQTPGDGTGGNIVNAAANEAWVLCESGYCYGYIFKSNNSFQMITQEGNTWTDVYSSTYTISDNVITIDGDPATYSISSDGKTLTLTFTEDGETYAATLTRTSGVVTGSGGDNGGETGGNLVNGANEAWVDMGDGTGFIFYADNTLSMIYRKSDGWYILTNGTWSTSGSNITLNIIGETLSGPYSVSGNTVVITIDGESETFTKTGNITINSSGDSANPDGVYSGGTVVVNDGNQIAATIVVSGKTVTVTGGDVDVAFTVDDWVDVTGLMSEQLAAAGYTDPIVLMGMLAEGQVTYISGKVHGIPIRAISGEAEKDGKYYGFNVISTLGLAKSPSGNVNPLKKILSQKLSLFSKAPVLWGGLSLGGR